MVSIITICFRNPEDLQDTLTSFHGLDRSLVEVIVVDGSPGDECSEVVRRHDVVSRYIHEADDGKYDAMNKGILNATGKSVVCINSGDRILNTECFNRAISDVLDILPHTIVYFDVGFAIKGDILYTPAPNITEHNLRIGNLPSHQATFVPALFYAHNKYDLGMLVAADTKLLLKAFRELRSHHVGQAITVFTHGGISGVSGLWSHELQHLQESYTVCQMSFLEKFMLFARLLTRKLIVDTLGTGALENWKYHRASRRLKKINKTAL